MTASLPAGWAQGVAGAGRALLAALALSVSLPSLTACDREPVDASPEAVVEEFLVRMHRHHGDPKAARLAYDLLWSEAKNNLAERAKRASALSGRNVAPEEMLVPSRFSLHFKPKKFESKINGEWAVVSISGEENQRHDVRCVLEDERWRVVVQVPALPPIQTRPDAG